MDREKFLSKIAPPLLEKSRELHRVFTLVDRLEDFVRYMSDNVAQMEEKVRFCVQQAPQLLSD